MRQYSDQTIEIGIARRSEARVRSPLAWPIASLAIFATCAALWFALAELVVHVL